MAFQLCAVAALASGLTLSSLVPHTLFPPLPLGALAPALLASALNLTLMQRERPLALLWHPYSVPSASGLQSTAFAFHLLSFRLRASPTPHPPLVPPLPLSAPLLLLGRWTQSCSWCGLASRAKWDAMHNYVVRGHHDGNISVPRHHVGILSLCIFLCAVLIKWRLPLSMMAAGEIQLVLVFTGLSSCLLKKAC